MTKVFADAFYFIALLNPSDRFHHTVVTRTSDLEKSLSSRC